MRADDAGRGGTKSVYSGHWRERRGVERPVPMQRQAHHVRRRPAAGAALRVRADDAGCGGPSSAIARLGRKVPAERRPLLRCLRPAAAASAARADAAPSALRSPRRPRKPRCACGRMTLDAAGPNPLMPAHSPSGAALSAGAAAAPSAPRSPAAGRGSRAARAGGSRWSARPFERDRAAGAKGASGMPPAAALLCPAGVRPAGASGAAEFCASRVGHAGAAEPRRAAGAAPRSPAAAGAALRVRADDAGRCELAAEAALRVRALHGECGGTASAIPGWAAKAPGNAARCCVLLAPQCRFYLFRTSGPTTALTFGASGGRQTTPVKPALMPTT